MISLHSAKYPLLRDKALNALLTERNVEEAARVTGVTVQTLYRWKKEPGFAEALRKARRANYRQALARLQKLSGVMIGLLLQILFDEDAPAAARLSAADVMFRYAKSASETEEIWARMLASRHAAEATSPAPSSGHGAKSDAQREAAIIALLTHRSVKEAARSVGIGVQTLYRWLQEPAFALAYLEARMEAFGDGAARCQQKITNATTTLSNIAGDARTPASLKVRAIALVLRYAQEASNEDIDTYIALSDAAPKAVLKLIRGGRGASGPGARERPRKAA